LSDLLQCTKCAPSLQPYPIPMQKGMGPERIMLVGEAPGSEEVTNRTPFVGSAGKVLNACLAQAGLKRGDFFVTNIIRCRPPNNRTPLDEEVNHCLPWLQQEIDLIKPTLLVALGDTATKTLTNKTLSWRGSIVDSVFGIPCLVTYHPAFVMRSREDFPTLIADLSKIRQGPSTIQPAYLYDPPLNVAQEKVEEWKRKGYLIVGDIETYGANKADALDPYKNVVIGVGFCGAPGDAFSLNLRIGSSSSDPKWMFIKGLIETTPMGWQGGIFDRSTLWVKGARGLTPHWDTMNAMYLLHSGSEKSLDFLRSVYTNIPPYKRTYKVKELGVGHLSIDQLAHYNCLDVDVTHRVMTAQKGYFTPSLNKLMLRMLALDDQAIIMRMRGVPISKEVIAHNFLTLEPEVARLEEEFHTRWGANPNSPKQLAELLYDRCKIPLPRKRRGKPDRTTDEEAILQLREVVVIQEDVEVLDALLSYREHSIILKTFVQGWFDRIGFDGRLHPEWVTTGTDTGRWSCRNPNMQNPPQRTRNQVVAPEGKVFIGADYRSLEFLLMLIMARDWANVKKVLDGRDIHGEVQEEMSQHFPATRLQAKAVVFGTGYGLTASSGARRFKVPLRIMQGWQEVCFKKFPLLIQLAEKHRGDFKVKGYAESFFGRRKYCQMETQALNHPIQSTGADITHNACLSLEREGFNPVINIHDEILCEIDIPSNPQATLRKFEEIMTNAGRELYEYFPCKPRISKCWQKEEE